MAERARIGVIGTGQIGTRHVETYRGFPEAEVVAVADVREEVARQVAQANGVPHVYADYRKLLERTDIQAVDVCLHNRLHAPVTLDALAAGKHVYCEKPMSWTYRDARRMLDAARQAGRMLCVQLGSLFGAEVRAAKRMVDGGLLGDLYYATASHYRRRGRPFVDGYGTAAFVNTATSGGGALLDMAVYHIAQALYLLGNPGVRTVSGSAFQKVENMYDERRRESGYDVEELGAAFVRLERGITLFVEEAWAIHAPEGGAAWVYGTRGGLRVSPLGYFTTLADVEIDGSADARSATWRWEQCDPAERYYSERQLHWVGALLGKVPLLDTAGIALNTALLTEGIYLSNLLAAEVTAAQIEQAEPGQGRKLTG